MVSPLVSGIMPATGGALPVVFERPSLPANAAVNVTPNTSAQSGSNNTQTSTFGKEQTTRTEQTVNDALNKVNDSMQAWATGIRFEMDDDTEQMVVKLVNNETGDVIRQVPSEAMLKVAKMIIQLQGGSINTQA